jgi:hypothetical protein
LGDWLGFDETLVELVEKRVKAARARAEAAGF